MLIEGGFRLIGEGVLTVLFWRDGRRRRDLRSFLAWGGERRPGRASDGLQRGKSDDSRDLAMCE